MRTLSLAGLLFLAAGCDRDEPPPPAPTPPPETSGQREPPPLVVPPPAPSPCRADAPVVVHRAASPLTGAVGISVKGDRGLVAFGDAPDLHVVPINGSGLPRGESRSIGGATGTLFAFTPVGEHHVAVFKERCDGSVCLHAVFLSAAGDVESTHVSPTLSPLWTKKHASEDGALVLAVGHEAGAPDMLRFTPEGVTHRTLPAPEESRTEVLGLIAERAEWTVVYRVGAAEAEDSRVVSLSTGQRAPTPLPSLHDALAIEALSPTEDGVAAIAAFEFSRPQFMVLGQEPELLAPDTRLPPPFTGGRRARVYRARGLTFADIETAAGDLVVRRIEVTRVAAAEDFEPDVARTGPTSFLVGTLRDDGYEVVTVRIRCDDT